MTRRDLLPLICLIVIVYITMGCERGKPNLTRENLNSIIPAGMTESNVYAILGTNAVVSRDNLGRKDLTYFFPYFPPPPGVNPKIDSLDVLISNGVVANAAIQWKETYHSETK